MCWETRAVKIFHSMKNIGSSLGHLNQGTYIGSKGLLYSRTLLGLLDSGTYVRTYSM